jgi:group II intron reverse transcriptase/maturase
MGRPTLWDSGEGERDGSDKPATGSSPGVRDPAHAQNLLAREPGYPGTTLAEEREGRPRKAQAEARTERSQGVGGMRSTGEAGEQGRLFDAAEPVEGRHPVKENANQDARLRTQCRGSLPDGLGRVRQAARRGERKFTALMHHIQEPLLREAYYALKKEAAPGVDGETWREYGKHLTARLKDLKERLQRGGYRPQPSKRVYVPKADGRMRPLGIAAVEDKVAQMAVVKVLEAIYEENFRGFSYGFRPGRGQHDALDALAVGLTGRISWVLDADIRGFFDNMDHGWTLKFLGHRIGDRRIIRLIRKWLRAGVSEGGKWKGTEVGTPQGAVISPLLANVYLHYTLDLWVEQWRKKEAKGEVVIVRYADDFVMGFQHRDEAQRFLKELGDRLKKMGLSLNQEKTRLIEFGRFAGKNRRDRGQGKPETFGFLGFTHFCGVTPKGKFTVKRKTNRKRLTSKLHDIREELRRRRHDPRRDVGKWLGSVVRGFYNYHAIPGNFTALDRFRDQVGRLWLMALRRQGQTRPLTWKRFYRSMGRWLPKGRILHPYPHARFAAKYPRQEPDAVAPHVRICPGGAW